ncbi:hypothetical protein DFJ66_2468 [Saccharothrix variisporea]|uniref:CdiA C-terminal tRNase domain-containing protein n=1 Tax=Saccharothrix variisporea TaxID=543527 RepID=A0A495X7X6_9PSEU|nr:hypothetical protein DFJ66_2468 [Saccharothrix variisporea]
MSELAQQIDGLPSQFVHAEVARPAVGVPGSVHRWKGIRNSGDGYDHNGITYDALGPFPCPEYFMQNWEQTKRGLVAHLEKADIMPIDVTGLSPEQVKMIVDFIAPLGPRIFIATL